MTSVTAATAAASQLHASHASGFQDRKRDLFFKFKFVANQQETETLEKISQKATDHLTRDEVLSAERFVWKVKQVLVDDAVRPAADELSLIFDTIFDLMRITMPYKPFHDASGMVLGFNRIFQQTSKYYALQNGCRLELPFKIYPKAYQLCTELINTNGLTLNKFRDLLESLTYIIDHHEFSPEIFQELYDNLVKWCDQYTYGIHSKRKTLLALSKLVNIPPYVRKKVVEELIAFVSKLPLPEEASTREWGIIHTLPFTSRDENVDVEHRLLITQTLLNIIKNPQEAPSVRSTCITTLSRRVWDTKQGQSKLEPEQLITIQTLLPLIQECKNYLGAEQQYCAATIGARLFAEVCFAPKEHPAQHYLFELFKQLLCGGTLPLKVREALATCLPHTDVRSPKTPDKNTGMELFTLAFEKLNDPKHPIELKAIYAPYLVSCYRYDLPLPIAELFPAFATAEKFLALPVIQNNESLKSIAKRAHWLVEGKVPQPLISPIQIDHRRELTVY